MNDNSLEHNYSLSNRLIAAFIGLAVVPLIIVGALLGWYIYSTHEEDAYAREEMLAQRTGDQLSNFLSSIELELRKASSLTRIAKLHKSEQQLFLERVLAKQWLFREIWFMDAAGRERVHISKYRLLVGTPHSDQIGRELFLKAARSGQTYFGPIYYETTTGEPMLDIALPIIDQGSSSLAGVLVAQVRAMQIWDLISRVKTVPGEAIYILDQRRRVIAHRNPSIVLRETIFPLRHDLKRQIGLHGKDAFIATDTVQIGQQTFTVVVERTAAMTAIPALTGMKIVGAVTILALGLALALFYRLIRQIIPPIQEVTSAARAIRNGDIERRVNLTSDDEVGELASAFNSMTARLRATLGELEREVRERMNREMELRKLNKSYVALSMSNHAVIHARDETELLQKICSIVVDVCEYRLAWIGLTEHDSGKNVRPIAHAGHDEDYLDTLNITWADTERGRGPTGRAIRERRAVVIHDLDDDPAFAPWRDQALERGYACCAAVPLISGQQVFGGLTVYGVTPSSFIEDELQLLSELADNVAYGIAALRAENARKAAMDEIRGERDFSQAILNTAGSIIVVLDTNGRIKRFNRTAETLTGYSFAEVVEKPFWEIFLLDEDLETIKGVFDCLGTSNIESRHESHWRMRDGSTRLFDWSNTLKFDELGNVAYIVAIGVDITKRKIAEAALRESEQSLRTMADFTYDWEYWQGPDREIWYITPSCERITGYSREEFLADPELINQIVYPEDRPLWDLQTKKETHDDIASLDFRIVHKDGTIRWLAHGCRAVYWGSGKFMGRRASVRDITDRKFIEEGWKKTSLLLRELAEHHEAVREEERTRVAREIHDELGQLLTALRMEVSLCRIKHGGSNPDLMERITSMQNLLSMTIDSVRVITKNLRPVALDLGIIAGIDWLAQEFHQHTGIPCQSELDNHLILDEKQSLVLFRVMQESLTNIAKHANALQVKLSLFHEGNFVVAVVRDNGTGFNKETLRSTKSFGLLGMHERLMMVCGELRVYSTLGKGTTILVHLPVASPNDTANTICSCKHAQEPLRH